MTEKKKEKKCFYGCGEPLDKHFHFSVIKSGVLVDAHERCHKLSQMGRKSTKFRMG